MQHVLKHCTFVVYVATIAQKRSPFAESKHKNPQVDWIKISKHSHTRWTKKRGKRAGIRSGQNQHPADRGQMGHSQVRNSVREGAKVDLCLLPPAPKVACSSRYHQFLLGGGEGKRENCHYLTCQSAIFNLFRCCRQNKKEKVYFLYISFSQYFCLLVSIETFGEGKIWETAELENCPLFDEHIWGRLLSVKFW